VPSPNGNNNNRPPRTNQQTPKVQGNNKDWKWFDGDLNEYYNSLEKDIQRDPNKVDSYAVHRWMGPKRSTQEQYNILNEAFARYMPVQSHLKVLDGGCGLGAGLMWMEEHHPHWDLRGYTISEEQHRFIETKLPQHKFKTNLRSFNELEAGSQYDIIFSIEAFIHSTNISQTIQQWSDHLNPGGIICIIDDFVASDITDKTDAGMQEFAKSWLANSLFTPSDLRSVGQKFGLEVAENRDLTKEYRIIELNYRNQKPNIHPFGGRTHQGWMGSKWRQRLTVEGKLTYNLMVLQKAAADA